MIVNETKLEQIRTALSGGKAIPSDDAWFLIEEVSRYRELLRHARYQTIQVSITAAPPKDDGEVGIVANVVASEEATERAVIRQIRRTLLKLMRHAE